MSEHAAAHDDRPATLGDLRELREDLKWLRAELRADMKEQRAELLGDMKELRTELLGDIKELRTELRDEMARADVMDERFKGILK